MFSCKMSRIKACFSADEDNLIREKDTETEGGRWVVTGGSTGVDEEKGTQSPQLSLRDKQGWW